MQTKTTKQPRPRSILFYCLLTLTPILAANTHGGTYGGGTGDPNDPFQIWTGDQMNAIGADHDHWDKHFKLMADIDLSGFGGTSFNLIGYYNTWQDNKAFVGIFDGGGHTISGFSYTTADARYVGLFSYVGTSGEIKDVALTNVAINVSDGSYVGGLVGSNKGLLSMCYTTGTVSGIYDVGGLVGSNSGQILHCHSTAIVTGAENVGSLVGENHGDISHCNASGDVSGSGDYVGGLVGLSYGDIENCYATGNVSGSGDYIGGLIGANGQWMTANGGTILGCYATGAVDGSGQVGGLIGRNEWKGIIRCCYATGSVSGFMAVGSLAGINNWGDIVSCYATGKVTGDEYIGGLTGETGGLAYLSYWDTERTGQATSAGGKGKSTAEMMSRDTYHGWGYDRMWRLDDGRDYPRLLWENTQGQLLTDGPRTYGGGSGEQSDPYQIRTPEQLGTMSWYRADFDKHFMLMTDLDMSGYNTNTMWVIGTNDTTFGGLFDGNGHCISNFTCRTNGGFAGLFGYVGPSGQINDLAMLNVNIDSGLVGRTGCLAVENAGSISNCYGTGTVVGTGNVGGLVGRNTGTIVDCGFEGQVVEGYRIGGLVGYNENIISRCYATGTVSGYVYVGGLVGDVGAYGSVSQCHATVDVTGNWNVGGFAGNNYGNIQLSFADGTVWGRQIPTGGMVGDIGGFVGYNGGNIWQCYARGDVFGTRDVGGLVGHNYQTVSECYASGQVIGMDGNVGGLVGGHSDKKGFYARCFWNSTANSDLRGVGSTRYNPAGVIGETSQKMKTESTYTQAGWDFNAPVWTIDDSNDFPEFAIVQNTAPTADAGSDITVHAWIDGLAVVEPNGFGSYDADGDELSYHWTWEIEGEVFDANGVAPAVKLPAGKHSLELVVFDGALYSEPNGVTVTVIAPLQAKAFVVPRVLNRTSRGKFVIAIFYPPDGIDADDIKDDSLILYVGGTKGVGIKADRQLTIGSGNKQRLLAIFDRNEVIAAAGNKTAAKLYISAKIKSGQYIFGTDTIRITKPHRRPLRQGNNRSSNRRPTR